MRLRFSNLRTLTLSEIERLDVARQAQFVAAMHGYSEAARAHETPRACVEALGDPCDEYSIELWDVLRDGDVVYEYWVQGAGDGKVFIAGTDETTFVHSVQHRFESLIDDDDAKELAHALGEAFPKSER